MGSDSFKMTKQRRMILEELARNKSHPTAYEVYELVRRKLPRISLGTIYRNLEILSEQGLALKLEMPGSQRRYDGDVSDHSHIRCSRCGRVDDLMANPVVNLDYSSAESAGYRITGHRLELIGLCGDCRHRDERSSA